MAKGVPILGKDPLGKAKYANVTESGDLRVQLSGADVPLPVQSSLRYYPNPARPRARIFQTTLDQKLFAVDEETGVWYSHTNSSVRYSDNQGTSWDIMWVPADDGITGGQIAGAWRLDNGAFLVSYFFHDNHDGALYLSEGEEVPDTDKTFQRVLDTPGGYIFSNFGFDVHGNLLFACEYGLQGNARRAWVSDDFGTTWRLIYEGPAVSGFHTHDIAYDPYRGAVYIVAGDLHQANLYWSYDWWSSVPTWGQMYSNESAAERNQFTAVAATPTRILLGSDKPPNGVWYIEKRGTGVQEFQPSDVKLGFRADGSPDLTLVFSTFAKAGGAWYVGASQVNAAISKPTPPVLIGTRNGIDFYEVYRHTVPVVQGGGFHRIFGSGDKLYGHFWLDSTSVGRNSIFEMDLPAWERM